jgi:hypothetical protein
MRENGTTAKAKSTNIDMLTRVELLDRAELLKVNPNIAIRSISENKTRTANSSVKATQMIYLLIALFTFLPQITWYGHEKV